MKPNKFERRIMRDLPRENKKIFHDNTGDFIGYIDDIVWSEDLKPIFKLNGKDYRLVCVSYNGKNGIDYRVEEKEIN